ncbi:MAG: putative flap endonuclease-1-like 5' DNA nuclease [Paraglaciecola sp.]
MVSFFCFIKNYFTFTQRSYLKMYCRSLKMPYFNKSAGIFKQLQRILNHKISMMKKDKSKTPKKDCGKLKAKVRELRKDARSAMDKKESTTKKYKRKLKKLVAELEPFKAAAMNSKKAFRKKKKAYLKAKEALSACLKPVAKIKKEKKAVVANKAAKATKKTTIAKPAKVKVTKKSEASPKATVKKAQRVTPIVKSVKPTTTTKVATKRTPYAVPSVAARKEKMPPKTPVKAPTNPRKSAVKPTKRATSTKDNLKRIEGVGPKIESLLQADGIMTFAQLSKAKIERLEKVLATAGPRFRMHKPTTWAEQAGIAAVGDWDQLKQLQEVLKGGKR